MHGIVVLAGFATFLEAASVSYALRLSRRLANPMLPKGTNEQGTSRHPGGSDSGSDDTMTRMLRGDSVSSKGASGRSSPTTPSEEDFLGQSTLGDHAHHGSGGHSGKPGSAALTMPPPSNVKAEHFFGGAVPDLGYDIPPEHREALTQLVLDDTMAAYAKKDKDVYKKISDYADTKHQIAQAQKVKKNLDAARVYTKVIEETSGKPSTKKNQRKINSAIESLSKKLMEGRDPKTQQELQRMADAARKNPEKARTLYKDHVLEWMRNMEKETGSTGRKYTKSLQRNEAHERLAQEVKDRKLKETMAKQGMRGDQYKHVVDDEETRKNKIINEKLLAMLHKASLPPEKQAALAKQQRKKEEEKAPMPKTELQRKVQGKEGQGTAQAVGTLEDKPPLSPDEIQKEENRKKKLQAKYAKKKQKKKEKQGDGASGKSPPKDDEGKGSSGSEAGGDEGPKSGV